jgi:hypothetical protein
VFSHFFGHSCGGGFFVLRPRRYILPRTWLRVSPSASAIWLVDIPWSASLVIFLASPRRRPLLISVRAHFGPSHSMTNDVLPDSTIRLAKFRSWKNQPVLASPIAAARLPRRHRTNLPSRPPAPGGGVPRRPFGDAGPDAIANKNSSLNQAGCRARIRLLQKAQISASAARVRSRASVSPAAWTG